MKTSSFSFELPEHLIAQTPSDRRDSSRLLVCTPVGDREKLQHTRTSELAELIPDNAVLVINDSRVRKSRIVAQRLRPGVPARECELLFLRPVSEESSPSTTTTTATKTWEVVVGNAGRNPSRGRYRLPAGIHAEVAPLSERTFRLTSDEPIEETWFDRHGHVPLPPYIKRPERPEDETRYQTVYARVPGSAAAPTAGLHFTDKILSRLVERGVTPARVTLHVGIGTFAPVRSDTVEEHVMHSERYHVGEQTARIVTEAKSQGRPIVAVGTTSVRTLESAWVRGQGLSPGSAQTNLFIYPGYEFQVVDELVTNFHTPQSSLLMLVSAFAGQERILRLYRSAIRHEYRFFSYGDAMYLRRAPQ